MLRILDASGSPPGLTPQRLRRFAGFLYAGCALGSLRLPKAQPAYRSAVIAHFHQSACESLAFDVVI
jgi:uncharacterized RDD family membrane protein YckC